MGGVIPPLPQYAFMAWCFVEFRYDFTFYLYLVFVNLYVIELSQMKSF
jgi:hypothetical protein